jgi:biotin operon repressor
MTQRTLTFDGPTYNPLLDRDRLTSQLGRVFSLMADGAWRSLAQIQARVGGSEAAVSARLRDLRKPRFGGHTVERRRAFIGGLWEYRLL